MRYRLKCKQCGAVAWADVEEDPDTNSFEIKGIPEWQDDPIMCEHEDFDVIDAEYSDDDMGA